MLFSGVHKMRKAAAQFESKVYSTGHQELTMAIFQDKCTIEAMQKVQQTKREAGDSWVKWAEQEENAPVRELFLKMADLDVMAFKIDNDYMVQCDSYRKYYKHILKGEKMVDDLRKQTDVHNAKTAKLQKQVETLHQKQSKTPDKKQEKKAEAKTDKKKEKHDSLEIELAKALSIQEGAVYNLKTREQNHEQFKYMKARDAWKMLIDAQVVYNSQCQLIAEARKQVLDLYTEPNFAMMHSNIIGRAQVESTAIVSALAEKLNMPKPSIHGGSSLTGEEGVNDPTYQATYMGIPEMEDSSDSTSPDGSRGSSMRSDTSQGQVDRLSRPLPPLPGEMGDEEYVNPDTMSIPPSHRKHDDQNPYLDLVAGEHKEEDVHGNLRSVYEMGDEEEEQVDYGRMWEASGRKRGPNYENYEIGIGVKGQTSQQVYDNPEVTRGSYQDMSGRQHGRPTIPEDTYEIT